MHSSDLFLRRFLVELLHSGALVRDLLRPRGDLDLDALLVEVARWEPHEAHERFVPDVVVVFRSRAGRPVLAVPVEVALHVDAARPAAWELFVAEASRLYRCSSLLLVMAPDPHVARWARTALAAGEGGVLRPSVLSYADIPIAVDAKMAKALPELAVLSALAHPTVEGVIAATVGISELHSEARALRIFEGLMGALPERLRGELGEGAGFAELTAAEAAEGSRDGARTSAIAGAEAAEAESC